MPEPNQAVCQSLIEHMQGWKTQEVQVDQNDRMVRNVALTGQESQNGYRYSEQALREGLPLYENKPVFLDHANARTRPHQRSTRDLVGSVINARYEEGRIRGDIRVIDTEAGRTFLALAESNSPAVGMSHVVLAEKNAEGTVVEKIHAIVSVDAVVFPATTKSFQEQHHAAPRDSLTANLAWLATEREALEQDVAQLRTELSQLQTQRDVERQLEEALLPPRAVTDLFRQQLLAAPSAEARQMLIQERRGLLDSLSTSAGPLPRRPQSQERFDDGPPGPASLSDEQLVNALRHR